MAKAKTVVQNETNEFYSLKDLAYKQAVTSDTLTAQAKYALANIKGFPDTLDDASKAELYAGYKLRFAEINSAPIYSLINGHYIPATESEKGTISLTPDYILSYSQQQFGRLKAENNALYEIIKPQREKLNDYCSDKLRDLKAKAKKIINAGTERHRNPTDDFDVALKKVLDTLSTRCRNAKSRGDATADEARLIRAKAAFMAEWNK